LLPAWPRAVTRFASAGRRPRFPRLARETEFAHLLSGLPGLVLLAEWTRCAARAARPLVKPQVSTRRFDPSRLWAYPSAVPFVLVHLACIAAFWTGVTFQALAIGLALYWLRIFGIGAGYHRYFAHRAYRASRVFQFVLAFLSKVRLKRACCGGRPRGAACTYSRKPQRTNSLWIGTIRVAASVLSLWPVFSSLTLNSRLSALRFRARPERRLYSWRSSPKTGAAAAMVPALKVRWLDGGAGGERGGERDRQRSTDPPCAPSGAFATRLPR
jgi:hypothetical protein